MPAAEALAAGLPLIVTGYSGQTDFAGVDVARQVDFRFAPSRSHLHSPGSVWAEPDVNDLAAALREIFDAAGDPTARRELAERVERGRLAAVPLADGARWAARVKDVAIELLSLGPARQAGRPDRRLGDDLERPLRGGDLFEIPARPVSQRGARRDRVMR